MGTFDPGLCAVVETPSTAKGLNLVVGVDVEWEVDDVCLAVVFVVAAGLKLDWCFGEGITGLKTDVGRGTYCEGVGT